MANANGFHIRETIIMTCLCLPIMNYSLIMLSECTINIIYVLLYELVTMDITHVAHISDSGPISTVHCPFSVFLPTIEWACGYGGSDSVTKEMTIRALPR